MRYIENIDISRYQAISIYRIARKSVYRYIAYIAKIAIISAKNWIFKRKPWCFSQFKSKYVSVIYHWNPLDLLILNFCFLYSITQKKMSCLQACSVVMWKCELSLMMMYSYEYNLLLDNLKYYLMWGNFPRKYRYRYQYCDFWQSKNMVSYRPKILDIAQPYVIVDLRFWTDFNSAPDKVQPTWSETGRD